MTDRSWTPGRRGWGALRLRLVRTAERADAVALVLAERPWAGTLAGVTVALGRSEARWGGEGREPRWLDGVVLSAQVERGRVGDNAHAAAGGGTPRPTTDDADEACSCGARPPGAPSLSSVGFVLAAARGSDREAAAEAALGA